MVWEKPPQDELTERDFRTLGIWPKYPEQKLILPRKRLDIPLPYRSGGFFNLSTELRWLADELDKTAKEQARMIDKIYRVKLRVEEVKAQFLELLTARKLFMPRTLRCSWASTDFIKFAFFEKQTGMQTNLESLRCAVSMETLLQGSFGRLQSQGPLLNLHGKPLNRD